MSNFRRSLLYIYNNSVIEGYEDLKYLITSSKQYIESPIYVTSNLKIEAELESLNFNTNQQTGGVYHYASGGTNFRGIIFRLSQNNTFTDVYYRNNAISNTCISSNILAKHKYVYDGINNQIYIDNNSPTNISYPITTSHPEATFYIGVRCDYTIYNKQLKTILLPATMKIYYVKSSGSLVHNLVPKLRVSDNKPGLYDLETNMFYVNIGKGEFGYETEDGRYVGAE